MPTKFQQKLLNTLAILGLSQTIIIRNRNKFTLQSSTLLQRLIYIILRVNSFAKFIFLVLLSCGYFQSEFEFFEKIAILLWYLLFIVMATSERIWCRTHPFFEILTAWWKVEERIYERLGRPEAFLRDVKRIAVSRVWFYGIIAVVGVLAFTVQYVAAPKFCTYTFSMFKSEDPILKWALGVHETLFAIHIWLVYGSVIYAFSTMGAEFTYCIQALKQIIDEFVEESHIKRKIYRGNVKINEDKLKRKVPETGVGYRNPVNVINDYKHVGMVVTQLNSFASYNFLYLLACSYFIMINDVFQLFQIMRSAEADLVAAIFYLEDMLVSMYMMFRFFNSTAFLHPTSVSFLEKYNDLCAMAPPNMTKFERGAHRKMYRSLRTTAFFIGPISMSEGFVGASMDALLQYYICVALWK